MRLLQPSSRSLLNPLQYEVRAVRLITSVHELRTYDVEASSEVHGTYDKPWQCTVAR